MLLACMSLAGTLPLLICGILWIVMRSKFPYRLGKKLLLLSMFFYLCPIQMVKFLLPTEIVNIISFTPMSRHYADYEKMFSFDVGENAYWIPKWLFYILAVWFLSIVIFSIYQVTKYLYQVKRLKKYSVEREIEITNVGKNSIRVSDYVSAPFTAGFLKPFIIFPEELLNEPSFWIMYRHEEAHKKSHDSLMKLICVIIACLHWFNPLSILLLIFYSIICEFVADGIAVSGCSEEERKTFSSMLIHLSYSKSNVPIVWKNGLLSGKQVLKGRMNYIMKKDVKARKILTVAAMALSVLMSVSTVMAYEPLQMHDAKNTELLISGEYGDFNISNQVSIDSYKCQNIFVTIDGFQYSINENSLEPNALCIHDMVTGYYTQHNSNSSGGCTVKEYNARRCEKCGYLIIGDLFATYTYVTCPH